MSSKKIMITGSNGLLGQKLVRLLAKQPGYALIATARGKNRLDDIAEGYTFEAMDITNRDEVNAMLEKHKPQYLINTAAMTNVDQCEVEKEACIAQNVEAVAYMVEACRANNSHLIHVSTDFIFDGTAGPYDEEAKANPLSFYGQSKADAETIVMNSGIKWSIARTVLVFGIAKDMSRTNIILWVKSSLEQGKQINVVTDQFRTPTLAEDLAMGCFLIAKNDAEGVFNISGREFYTPYEMAVITADYYGLDKSLINPTDSTKFTQPAKRPPRTGFIITKAEQVLGYQPHSFTEGIQIMQDQVNLLAAGGSL